MEIIRKKNFYVLLCCVAFFLCNFDSTLVAAKEMVFDVVALMEIKSRLVDPYGVLESWDEAVPDPCTWNMITCSTDYQVIALEAPDRGLSGTLSPYIGNLTYIQSVHLQSNNLSGNIPSSIGALSNLRTLELSNNKFSGQIPSSISHLESLQYLMLNNNSLSGEIPDSLANLTHLTLLDLSFNNLSGDVPKFPAKVYNIVGNPYICSDGADKKVGCLAMDLGSLPTSSSSKAKLISFPSAIYRLLAIFYVMLILASHIFS